MLNYKVVIIGSGIAGMSAAIYLKRAGINPLIIESSVPGGQLNRSSIIENYPGILNIDGPSLALNIYNQVNQLKIDYLFSSVTKIDGYRKMVITSKKEVKYDYLIIASGRSPKKIDIKDADKLLGHGISYCAICDGMLYKDLKVAVLGGGNSALEEAIYLSNICKEVIIINHNEKFRGEDKLINQVYNINNISILFKTNIKKCEQVDNKLSSLILSDGKKIQCAALFVDIGYLPNSEFYNGKKIKGYIEVDKDYKTSQKKIYACGDIINKTTYQLSTAVGEAATVANNIIRQIEKGM